MACFLADAGVSRGDRVALLAPNGAHHITLLAACARLGAIFVPLNWRLSPKELGGVLDNADPRVWLVDKEMLELALATGRRRNLMMLEHATLRKERTHLPEVSVDDDSPALLIYTSGTTGTPRGAVLSHRALRESAEQFVEGLSLNSRDINYASAPLFHIAGLATLTLPLLMVGGTSVISSSKEPREILDHITEHRCTCAFFVPAVWRRVVAPEVSRMNDFITMRFGLVGGAPCPPELRRRCAAAGVPLSIGYGMTEAAPMVTLLPHHESGDEGCVGYPGERISLEIRSPEGARLDDGEIGQVHISAPNLMSGYWTGEGSPLDTGRLRGGWFASHDLGYIDPEGRLVLVGRMHDMIITGGENVHPEEVERALMRTFGDALEECAVLGVSGGEFGERVCCALVWRGGHFSRESVIAKLREHLAGYKIPRQFMLLDALPRNGTGKVDRGALRRFFKNQDILAS